MSSNDNIMFVIAVVLFIIQIASCLFLKNQHNKVFVPIYLALVFDVLYCVCVAYFAFSNIIMAILIGLVFAITLPFQCWQYIILPIVVAWLIYLFSISFTKNR